MSALQGILSKAEGLLFRLRPSLYLRLKTTFSTGASNQREHRRESVRLLRPFPQCRQLRQCWTDPPNPDVRHRPSLLRHRRHLVEGDQQEQLFPPEQLQHLQLLPPALTSSRLTLPWSGLALLVSLQPLLIPDWTWRTLTPLVPPTSRRSSARASPSPQPGGRDHRQGDSHRGIHQYHNPHPLLLHHLLPQPHHHLQDLEAGVASHPDVASSNNRKSSKRKKNRRSSQHQDVEFQRAEGGLHKLQFRLPMML